VDVVSIGGLVVAHVSWRLLLSRTPRQCAMPRHNGNFSCALLPTYIAVWSMSQKFLFVFALASAMAVFNEKKS
jgi:hypothetical protein